MRGAGVLVGAALGLVTVVSARADDLRQVFPAPADRVWTATQTALGRLGWGIDDADRTLGLVVTKSKRLEGDDAGLHAKNRRVRLRVRVNADAPGSTVVAVERELFVRERILWIDRDEPIASADPLVIQDRRLERALLNAIGEAL